MMARRVWIIGILSVLAQRGDAQAGSDNIIRYTFKLPFSEEFVTNQQAVRNRRGDVGTASIRTAVQMYYDGDEVRIEGKVVLEKSTIDDAECEVMLDIATDANDSLWGNEWDLEADKDPDKDEKRIFDEERRARVENAHEVVIVHTAKVWRGDRKNPPGPIEQTTGRTHIIIIPGILGDTDAVQDIESLLEDPKLKDPAGGRITVQIWDWTRDWRRPRGLQAKIRINEKTRVIGRSLADHLRDWKNAGPPAKDVHIMGLSAGSLIVATACEAADEKGMILGEEFFGHVLFLSAVLSVRHDLKDVDRCSKGIYNYYSDKDDILTASFPRIFAVFTLPVAVSWPAIGRFGYSTKDEESKQHRVLQLPWLREEYGGTAEDLGNSGRHLNPGCLEEKYFERFILPLFTGGEEALPKRPNIDDGWDIKLHPCYQQDQTFTKACEPKKEKR